MTDADPPRDDLRRRAFGALASTSVVVVVDRTVQILLLSVVARLVSPEQTAVAAAVGLVIGIAVLICSWGMTSVLIQAPELTVRTESVARSILLALGVAAFICVEIAAPLGEAWFHSAEVVSGLRVGALVLLAGPFATVAGAHLWRNLRARDAALADLFSSLLATCLTVIPLAVMGLGYWSLVIGAVVQGVVRAVLLCLFARQRLGMANDMAVAAVLLGKGLGFMTNGLLNKGEHDAPRWLIGRFLPTTALGYYTRAASLMTYPASLFSAIAERVIFPAVGQVQLDAERLKRGVNEAVQLTALAGLPLTVSLFILGPDIIRLFLGPAWDGAIEPFRILSLVIYAGIGDRLTWTILRGTGRTTLLSVLQFFTLLGLVAGCLVGAPYGLAAVCIAVTAVMLISFLVKAAISMKTVGVAAGDWFLAHTPALASSVLAAVALLPLSILLHNLKAPPILVLAACGLLGLGMAAAGFKLAPRVFLGQAGGRLLHAATHFVTRAKVRS